MTRLMSGVCEAESISSHYLRTGGDKPPLILLHGLTGNGACWTALARSLANEYDVVMPDARGHGQSSTPLHGFRYEDHARDVMALIHGLGLLSAAAGTLDGRHDGGGGGESSRRDDPRRHPGRSDVGEPAASARSLRQRRRRAASPVARPGSRRRAGRLKSRHARRSAEVLDLLVSARLQTRISAFDVLTPPNPDYRQLVRTIAVPILIVIGDAGVVSLETASELQGLKRAHPGRADPGCRPRGSL